jgi:hypothetical protein
LGRKKKETKSKTKKQGKIRRKKKKHGKANLYQAYHHDLVQNQSSLFNHRNRYNIITTMWKKQKGYVGNGKKKNNGKKKQKVAWEKHCYFSHAF